MSQVIRKSLIVLGLVIPFWISWPSFAASLQPDLERRLSIVEDARPDARLSAIEARLNNIESVMQGLLVAVAAQIIVSGFQIPSTLRRRRP